MDQNKNSLYLLLTIFSLLLLGGVFLAGIMKKNQEKSASLPPGASILGESIEKIAAPANFSELKQDVQGSLESTLNNTKDSLAQRAVEVEKQIMDNFRKEITNMTRAQVDSLKIQLCTDLGVLPSATPTP
jgi:hypothetical protein